MTRHKISILTTCLTLFSPIIADINQELKHDQLANSMEILKNYANLLQENQNLKNFENFKKYENLENEFLKFKSESRMEIENLKEKLVELEEKVSEVSSAIVPMNDKIERLELEILKKNKVIAQQNLNFRRVLAEERKVIGKTLTEIIPD